MIFGKIGTSLIALSLGYIVCYLASKKEEKLLKNAGYFIGVFIITLSAILIVADLLFGLKACGQDKTRALHRMMKGHQMMQQPMLPPK